MDLEVEKDVVAYMSEATSEAYWNDRCDAVKKANGNDYPSFWFRAIILSGVYNETTARW